MGFFKKEKSYGKQVDLQVLTNRFSDYLQSNKWKVQQQVQGTRAVIQAQKGGILRDIVSANRALTFVFDNTPQGLSVNVGVGKWLTNIGAMVIETLLLSELFLVVDIPEILFTEHIERELIAELDNIVSSI